MLWRDPGTVEQLDLVGGAAGRAGAPKPPFTFIEESLSGTNPKVKIKDANNVQWTIKFGSEVNAETFASRLVWAVGYFVEPAFFVPSGTVQGLNGASFKRVKKEMLDPATGRFVEARFERQKDKGVTKFEDAESWAYEDNPFLKTPEGTRQLNGLKVMMMLVSNWDNKDVRDAGRGSNTAIFQYPSEARYLVTDWGGSMGKWGGVLSREKWDCRGFASQTKDFVKGVLNDEVRFGYSGQHTSTFVKGITTADVKWLLDYLGRVSDVQIQEALRASGAKPEEVPCFTGALRDRVNQLRRLSQGPDSGKNSFVFELPNDSVSAPPLIESSRPSAQSPPRGVGSRPTAAPTARRIALVLGNSKYQEGPLANPVNDANGMAAVLSEFGFEVIKGLDLDRRDMLKRIREFGDKMQAGGVGLFFFAGHGLQVKGLNYLVPIGATITKDTEVEFEAIEVGFVLAQMEAAKNQVNIVILDACRNNPFARSFRSGGRGLASIDAPKGSIIAYATAPGSVASDGPGNNGLYTSALLKHLRVPGRSLEEIFSATRDEVMRKTDDAQVPWESTSLRGRFRSERQQ